jgi:RNA polymerase sigma-70 factor (ECF subfamily)
MSEVDDVGLIERARRGDEVAFSQLFAKHQRAIYRYAVYMSGPDAADDVVQETFLAVLRQTTRHDTPRGTIVGYLLGIARHVMMKRLAKNVAFDEPMDDSVGDTAAVDQATVLDDLTRAETIEAVRTAVHSLPPAYREVVVLCDFQEMDYAGAADLMQCPIGTIRSRLSRARSLLTIKLAAAEPVVRKSAVAAVCRPRFVGPGL